MKKHNIQLVYHLSPVQLGLLFQTLSSLESDIYVVQNVFELEGELNISILKQAWQVVSNHHTTLRTGFVWGHGKTPAQYVLGNLEVPFIFYDYSILPEIDRENKLELLIKMDREKAYDLAKAPLYRVYLVKDHDKKHYLIWSQHHILIDGWSTPIILADVLKAYSQINLGKSLILEHRPPYRNYIAWLQQQDLQAAKDFWVQYLSSINEPTRLSFNSMINNKPEYSYADHEINLSSLDSEKIREFTKKYRITLNTLFQGAVGAVIKNYTQSSEVVFGITVSGRNIDLANVEDMVGLFINTMPLKINFKNNEDILSFLRRLQNDTQSINNYSYTPLADIQNWTKIHQSLFDVILVFENYPISEEVTNIPLDFTIKNVQGIEKTEYPLTIVVSPGEQINIILSYQTEHYNEYIIHNIAKHIEQVLLSIISLKKYGLQDISLLSKEERKHILVDWNETNVDFPSNKTIQQMFEEQVVRTPANIAVVYENKKLSYKQLNDKSNQLAHYLRCIGVGPDVLVAIAADRCNEMIIGLLGILKAGGAYVPIDPSYPQARIEFMLEDTRASVLLATSSMRSRLDFYKGNVIFIDEQDTWKKLSKQPKDNPSIINTPNHLAYLIYTSGSTGNPKGVMIEHIGLLNRLIWMRTKYRLTTKDCFLQKTPSSFDVSVWELFLPLMIGSIGIIAKHEHHKDPKYLSDLIINHEVTICHFVPSMLKNFLAVNDLKNYKSLRLVIASGEVLSNSLTKQFAEQQEGVILKNLYGPTEASIDVTDFECSKSVNITILIGKPIDNTKIYILDTVLEPVPIGVMGEIYIAGVGLARGYLNNPGLTAEKFIANPFATPQDISLGYTRLYRTGDIGRYLPDGNIEYKGRIDDQVKIRGFRIELGEIENALNHYTDIEHSVVVSDGDDGNKHLVAYVVPTKEIRKQLSQETQFISSAKDTCSTLTGDIAPSMSEALRGHLSTTLPDYMIPAFFVYIDKIPLTSNGKIDRKSLPAPDLSLRLVTEQYVEPRNDVERELCNIWKDVLNVSQVGIYDNFFGIGGDSIISIQVVSRARLKGLYFSIKDIFSNPTIIELSKVTTKENTCGGIQAEQGLISGSVPLTPIQHWFFSAKLDDNNHFNQAVMLEVSSKVNADMINKAINLLIKHHDALRHRYTKDKQRKWTQACIEINQEFDTDIISISNSLSDKETLDKISDKSTSIHKQIDIENGPLIRTALFNCEDSNNQTLLIVIHHLVVDGVSWRILIEDLNRICEDILLDKNPTLPQKTHSYKQWAELLTEYASSNDIKKEYSYWNNLVINIKALPTDFENKHATVGDMITVQTSLTEQETDVMLHKVPNAYNTQVNDILLTALTLAIGDWSNFYEIFLSLEGHGREDISNDIDTSRTVGWFTTIFPVYLKIEEPNDIGESIKAIKEELRAIPNKGIGYGILAYLLDKAVLNSHDNPSISFNYLGQWDNVSLKDNLFMHSPKPSGQSVSPINKQSHLIDINAEIRNNKLDFFISYSNKHYKHQTIENIASLLSKRLRQLIDHCNQDNTIGYTPSDFDLSTSNKDILNDRISKISKGLLITSEIKDIYPLSPIQSGLLFSTLSSLEPDVYVVQSVFELEGELDISILKQAWQVVSNYHTTLRTGFIWEDGQEAEQYVLKNLEVPFIFYDYSALSEIDRENKLELLIKMDREKAYDLAKAPLYRVYLVKDHDKKHYLIWSQHHILIDGWSTPIILADVLKAYSQINLGKSLILEHRPPYRNYIAWLQQQELQAAKDFWVQYLSSINEPTRLSFNSMINNKPEYSYADHEINLSSLDSEKIREFTKKYRITLNTLFQGAVGAVIKNYTQSSEVVFGITVSGRNIDLANVEDMVGLFINTMPLKINFKNNEDILSFLRRLQNDTQSINNYSYTPLADIQNWTKIHQSLFDVILVFENYPISEEVTNIPLDFTIKNVQGIEKTEYPLTIVVSPGEQINIILSYQTEHYNEYIIHNIAKHIEQVLLSIISLKKYGLQDISLLSKEERKHILVDWNETNVDFPSNKTIQQMFEEQVVRTPANIAVVYENKKLSYKQLNDKSNQLAHYLRCIGVGPDVLVAIAADRCNEMIIGLLGILKAGGAYVPIDPSYPQARIEFMLEDTRASVLLATSSMRSRLDFYKGNVIFIDEQDTWKKLSKQPKDNPSIINTSNHLAYVIYTSGSTGNPKGVMVQHLGVVNNVLSAMKYRDVTSNSRVSNIASFAFDTSVLEIYPTLLSGASLFIFTKTCSKDLYQIKDYCIRNKITNLVLSTKIGEEFLKLNNLNSELKTLVVAGENLDFIQLKDFNIINDYGPTENSVSVSHYKIDSLRKSYPIGLPNNNTKIYILDTGLEPVPIGVMGEIYIAGVGLARGYLNNPRLTAEKFIANPFATPQDISLGYTRLYRTGDIGRYLPDGNIEYKGRIDDQVKIRGFRIELGEIENALNHYTDIEHSVVVSDGDDGNKHLVAYVVPTKEIRKQLSQETQFISSAKDTCSTLTGDIALSMSEVLREHLSTILPDYMIPAFFVYIDKIPLTSNGKIDKKSLPALDINKQLQSSNAKPRNEIESCLFNIYQNILGINNIGIDDNFFELGGNSIMVIRLVEQARRKGIILNAEDIFQHTTIKKISSKVSIDIDSNFSGYNVSDDPNYNDLKMDFDQYVKNFKYENINSIDKIESNNILLTGVTGFIGIFVLKELLENTNSNIYCIIREQQERSIESKFHEQINKYELNFSLSEIKRIIFLPGNISKNYLGLSEKKWDELTKKIDIIFHAGAQVHHLYSYSTLRATNVMSTANLTELAKHGKSKQINYISSSGIFESSKYHPAEITNSQLHKLYLRYGGYALSKIMSELILINAQYHGLSVRIYRLGNITGSTLSGASNYSNNHLLLLTKGCVQLGYAPDLKHMTLEMTPVNVIANMIVKISQQKDKEIIYELSNSNKISWTNYIYIINQFGFKIKIIRFNHWLKKLSRISKENSLFTLKSYYTDQESAKENTEVHENNIHELNILQQESKEILIKLGLKHPNDYKKLIKLYLDYLQSVEWI